MQSDIKGRRLIQDNDSHWYLIPADQEDNFWKWVGEQYDSEYDFEGYRIDGPHLLTIYEWK